MSKLWLDRTLLVGPFLALATSEAELKILVKEAKVEPPEHWCGNSNWHACTHSWYNPEGLVCIVCINLDHTKNMKPTHVAALIVHEATHVWQETKQTIGGNIGNESEAYAMQNICRELFDAYSIRARGRDAA